MDKPSKSNDIVKSIFSTKGIIIFALLLVGYLFFFRGNNSEEKAVTSTKPAAPFVGVSDQLSAQAIALDLSEHLDPKLVPSLVEQAMKETVEAGTKDENFVPVLVTKVSNMIREISTIDLNEDGFADPLLVLPQNVEEGQEHLQLSIRVPDPAEVTELPPGSDQEAWLDIADNKSIEIMSTTAIKGADDGVTIQSAPNQQMYSSHPPYYHHHSSFGSMLMTSMMIHYMFAPRMGYGFGGYGYPPRQTTVVRQSKGGASSSLSSATASSSAAKNASGKSVATNNFKKVPPKSLNQIKTNQFKARNTAASSRTGGFGKSGSAVNSQPKSVQQPKRSSTRRSGGFGGSRRRR